MSDKLKLPLPREITRARKFLKSRDIDAYSQTDFARRIMACWEGECWHKDEVFFGILIGLQIAKDRTKRLFEGI